MNCPSEYVCMHMHVHMYVCMSAVCRKMKHLAIVFMTSQRTTKDTGKGQSQVLPAVTHAG